MRVSRDGFGSFGAGKQICRARGANLARRLALALSKGLAALEPIKIWSMAIGGALGIMLPLLSLFFPKHEKYISVGRAHLGWHGRFSGIFSLLFFLGGVVGWGYSKISPKRSEEFHFPGRLRDHRGRSADGSRSRLRRQGKRGIPQLWQKTASLNGVAPASSPARETE